MEKRYLVYKSWNGKIHASIEYGNLTNVEGRAEHDPLELKRIELNENDSNDLYNLKVLYPLEETKNEAPVINF